MPRKYDSRRGFAYDVPEEPRAEAKPKKKAKTTNKSKSAKKKSVVSRIFKR